MPISLYEPDFPLVPIGVLMEQMPQPAFHKYLSLYNKSEHAKGLTIYVAEGRIFGLEAHFGHTSHLSGYRFGLPKYFPFHPEERVAYAWLELPYLQLNIYPCNPILTVSLENKIKS